jgi:tripartite-type tricarboxylate transporter receptor subunit TctC
VTITRRSLCAGMASAPLWASSQAARAQSWPAKPITFVVPYPAGGTTDLLARMIAEHWKEKLGLAFVMENRPGAATTVGASQVARAEPDGHTLLMVTSTTMAVNTSLYRKLPYDPVADFQMINMVAGIAFTLIVTPGLPVKTLQEFAAYAKERPGQLTYASPGNGSPQHLAGEMFKTVAGIDMKHVTYRGSVAAMNDIVGGHIPAMFMDLPPAIPLIKDGKLRALGVASPARVAALPDLPTVAEQGYPGFDVVAWQGVAAPAKTPREVIGKLSDAAQSFASDANRQKLITLGMEPLEPGKPEALAAYVKTEIDRWAPIVKASGATTDQAH